MIDSDEEKLTALEKRHADLIAESDNMKTMIQDTIHKNNQMIHTMDMILNSAMFNVDLAQKGLPLNTGQPTVRLLLFFF